MKSTIIAVSKMDQQGQRLMDVYSDTDLTVGECLEIRGNHSGIYRVTRVGPTVVRAGMREEVVNLVIVSGSEHPGGSIRVLVND